MSCELEHPPGCVRNEIHTPGRLIVAVLVYVDPTSPSGVSAHIQGEGGVPAGPSAAALLRAIADTHERQHQARNS